MYHQGGYHSSFRGRRIPHHAWNEGERPQNIPPREVPLFWEDRAGEPNHFRRRGRGHGHHRGRGGSHFRDNEAHCSNRGVGDRNHPRSRGNRSAGRNTPEGVKKSGRPPHLRGKEIGLYYRDLSRKKNKNITVPVLKLSNDKVTEIEEIIRDLKEEKYTPGKSDTILPLRSHFEKEYSDIISVSFMEKLEYCLKQRDRKVDLDLLEKRNEDLHDEMINKMKNKTYLNMLEFRKSLPTYQHRPRIVRTIKSNPVVVISGDTGCGKSTQVGQLILEDACVNGHGGDVRILITQPRRLAATSVAARIADERAEVLGNSVGYAIRLETVPPREFGSIEVVTAGVVLQRLQRDPALMNVSHLIIDEAHERDITCDILIGIVKQILWKRDDLKVILMSATMDSSRFCQYFNGCPIVEIPGRMFDVEVFYLEDALQMTGFTDFKKPILPYGHNFRSRKSRQNEMGRKQEEHRRKLYHYVNQLRFTNKYRDSVLETLLRLESEDLSIDLATELVIKLCYTEEPGAILVFLPGMSNISAMCRQLQSVESELPPHVIYPLHSQLSSLDQNAIFREPPKGVRKIIVSTNIAETSITIDDVVYVVDCGKMKLGNYDADHDIKTLQAEWLSQANALQRQGRAGRVRPGKCYRLYTKVVFHELPVRTVPEILRSPVHEPLLASLLLRLHPAPQFLATLMDPPQQAAVQTAVDLLTRMDILNESEHLTPLGVHVARLPVSPGPARMLIYSSLLSAVGPITRVAAVQAFKDPFTVVVGQEKEADAAKCAFSKGTFSDQLAAAEAQREWEEVQARGSRGESLAFCRENYLSERTLQLLYNMRRQFGQCLRDTHFINDDNPDELQCNRNSHSVPLLKALIVAGLYPNVAYYKERKGIRKGLMTDEDGKVNIHMCSVNSHQKPDAKYLVYRLKQLSTSLFLHDTSTAMALPLLFFGDRFNVTELGSDPSQCILWCGTFCWLSSKKVGALVETLRGSLHDLLQKRLQDPRPVQWDTTEGTILNCVVDLISAEETEGSRDVSVNDLMYREDVKEATQVKGMKSKMQEMRLKRLQARYGTQELEDSDEDDYQMPREPMDYTSHYFY